MLIGRGIMHLLPGRIAYWFVLPVFAVACGGRTSSSTGSGGHPGSGGSSTATDGGPESGSSGTGGLIIDDGGVLDAASMKSCPWPSTATQPASTSWEQRWCDGTVTNPPGCPGTLPAYGTPCATGGMVCGYDAGSVLWKATCNNGAWINVHGACQLECPALDAGVAGIDLSAVACGSKGNVGCSGSSKLNNWALLDATLESIADCCGRVDESTVTVTFKDGCATAVHGSHMPMPIVDCFAATLAGRRLACATGQTCASVTWSTLP